MTTDGVTLAVRTADLLARVCEPVVEVGPGRSALPRVTEEAPGDGPLVAVASAAAHFAQRGVRAGPLLVVATDLPRLRIEVLAELCSASPGATVVPRIAGIPQTLCARYDATVAERSIELVAAGERSMRALLSGAVTYLDDAFWSDRGLLACFDDLDTMGDFERFRADGVLR